MKIPTNPILEQLLVTARHKNTNQAEFSRSIVDIGYHLALAISSTLPTNDVEVETELGITTHKLATQQPNLVVLLRAGEKLYEGFAKAFPYSPVSFIGTARNEQTLKSEITYWTDSIQPQNPTILIDTMLATGGSILDVAQRIRLNSQSQIYAACAFASQYGHDAVEAQNIAVYAAVIDTELNEKGYIVPGLGDAGDKLYGQKK
jgi:uracil phosphoribosyltransferase